MWLFGSDNAFGWRFGAALTGTLSILIIALIAQALFKSTALGGVAGLLTAIDGHHLVHSRTSLLDIFLMFWVVAAFGCLLLDRSDGRRRLAAKIARLTGSSGVPHPARLLYGPWVLWRPWRLAAGVCLGLAVGTKWSALAFVAVFGLMCVLWDLSARRAAGITEWFPAGVLRDGVPAFFTMIPVAALTYLASWTGWLRSDNAYDRHWAASNPSERWGWLPDWLRSLAEYHRSAYAFHNGLHSEHPYESNAWTWLFMGRPTSFYYHSEEAGHGACHAVNRCSEAVTVVGNPLIWWAAAASLLVLLFCWAGRRDWRAGAILAGVAAGYLPWFLYPERHHLLLLRHFLPAIPGTRTDLHARAGAGPADGPALAPPPRRSGGRAVCRGRPLGLGVLPAGLDRRADRLQPVALADVDAELDLMQARHTTFPDAESGHEVREAVTELLAAMPAWSNITDILVAQHQSDPQRALYAVKRNGSWSDVSAAELLGQVTALAKGLMASGIGAGDTVAVMSKTRFEWTVVDLAGWFAGAVVVPIYETSSPLQVQWILQDSAAKMVFAEDAAKEAVVRQAMSGLPAELPVCRLDGSGDGLAQLTAVGSAVTDEELELRRTSRGMQDAASWSTPRAPPDGRAAASSATATSPNWRSTRWSSCRRS